MVTLPSARAGVKALLARAKNHALLGDADAACAMYEAADDGAGYCGADATAPPAALLNNRAVCLMRKYAGGDLGHVADVLERAAESRGSAEHRKMIATNRQLVELWAKEGFHSRPEEKNMGLIF